MTDKNTAALAAAERHTMTTPTPHGQVPEALRLAVSSSAMADEGEMIHLLSWHEIRNLLRADATELRRQHARIAELEDQGGELLEALRDIANNGMDARQCMLTARTAIAKATG